MHLVLKMHWHRPKPHKQPISLTLPTQVIHLQIVSLAMWQLQDVLYHDIT
jgi:hypothetical protein